MVHMTETLVLRTLDPVLWFQALHMAPCWVLGKIALLCLTCASHTGIQLGWQSVVEAPTECDGRNVMD